MRRRRTSVCAFPVLALLTALTLAAPSLGADGAWRLFGSNELTVNYYDVGGDESASPYRFEGTFFTNRLSLGVEYAGDYRSFRITATGRGADDDYLADESTLETLALALEDGTRRVPYRLHAGDLFADLSRRTVSQQIKGVSIELQPQFARGEHSLLLVSGSGVSGWEEAVDETDELVYTGVSYLVASRSGAHSLVANVVDVVQAAPRSVTGEPLGPDRDHRLGSLYGETAFGGVRLEGELAALRLDDDSVGDQEEDDETSFYAQLASVRNGRFAWKLRYEDNGETYVTPGAVGVIADRRLGELEARYRLGGSGTFRLRAQTIERDVDGPDSTTEIEAGSLGYRGRIWKERPTLLVALAADVNDIATEDGSREQLFESYRFGIEDRFGAYDAEYEAIYRSSDDELDDDGDRESIDHELTVGRTVSWRRGDEAPVRLRLGGGLVYREQRRTGAFDSWSPLVDLSLAARHHRLTLHLSFLEQDFEAMTVDDLRYVTQRLTYTFDRDRHRLSFDVANERRDPDGARRTDSLRLRGAYRVSFDRSWSR